MDEFASYKYKAEAKTFQLNEANFYTVMKSEGLMITDFWAKWCGPCRMMSQLVDEMARKYDGKMTFSKLDIETNPMIAEQLGITSIPTFIITYKGHVIDVIVGARPKEDFEFLINYYIGKSLRITQGRQENSKESG